MKRVWMNHWFSTAYSILGLIRQSDPDLFLIGSSANRLSPIQTVCDAWYQEPVLKDEEDYAAYCLDFCREHGVDAFLPRRGMLAVSRHLDRFEALGVKVMADPYERIAPLNRKDEAYALFRREGIGTVPDYRIAVTAEEFRLGYEALAPRYERICFKFIRDEGGKSFRLIDGSRSGYAGLFHKQTTRITYAAALAALSERETFPPIMLMPYLPDEEISVDCLKTGQGLILVPRVKDASRVEAIRYDPEILAVCEDFFAKVPLEQPCNIQFKYLDGVPYLLEVNTRMSGGIHMACLGSGINIPGIAVGKLLGVERTWKNERRETLVSHIEIPVVLPGPAR